VTLLYYYWKRYLATICFLIVCSTQANAQPQLHDNCGVNSALVVLLRFNKPCYTDQVITSLGVGPDLSYPTNFASLTRLFTESNLNCYSFKEASITDIEQYLNNKTLAVIQTLNSPSNHLLVVSKRKDGEIAIDDYPHLNIAMTRTHFSNAYNKIFSGNVLFVSSDTNAALKSMSDKEHTSDESRNFTAQTVSNTAAPNDIKDSVQTPSRIMTQNRELLKGDYIQMPGSVDLGDISSRSKEISCNVEIVNFSEHVVSIKDIKGSCSCFLGAKNMVKNLNPHDSAILDLRFNTKQIADLSSNMIARSVVIETSDPKLSAAQISIKGRLVPFTEWGVSPPKIDLGSVFIKPIKKIKARVDLLATSDQSRDEVEVLLGPNRNIDYSVELLPNIKNSGTYFRYGYIDINIKSLPVGKFKYEIQIRNKKTNDVQVVEVTGTSYME